MNLKLDWDLARGYHSGAQRARVVTEAWAEDNLPCVCCNCDELDRAPSGMKVVDFSCPECEERFQLKSRCGSFGSKVVDSAYEPMVESIRSGAAPNLLLLSYQPEPGYVRGLSLVNRLLWTPLVIEKRRPLSPKAKRAGWVGCNILTSCLPRGAMIPVVFEGEPRPISLVRKEWQAFSFAKKVAPNARGWLADVLWCLRSLGKDEFTLAEVYEFEGTLSDLHPENRHIKPKVRQQLQVLRDQGILKFRSRGRYSIVG